jgi:hypothetical protein
VAGIAAMRFSSDAISESMSGPLRAWSIQGWMDFL